MGNCCSNETLEDKEAAFAKGFSLKTMNRLQN
jgi:hypothetical protein